MDILISLAAALAITVATLGGFALLGLIAAFALVPDTAEARAWRAQW